MTKCFFPYLHPTRSWEIITENCFCAGHKIKRKRIQHFKLLFFKPNLHSGTSNCISTCRKLNLLLVNSTYLIVSAPLKQGRPMQTRVHFKFCYSVRIETTHKPSKLFASVHVIDATWFDECFLFDVVNRRHYFWQKFVVT